MNKLEDPVSDQWVVHVYGQNRKLLWVFDPSHGWMFLLGLGVGILLSVVHVNLARTTGEAETMPVPQSVEAPPLQVD